MRYLALLAGCLAAVNVFAVTEGDVPAAKLLEAVKQGTLIAETKNAFQSDMENKKDISMYQLKGATTWTSDMDVDCDGAATTNCNKSRDPWFQNQLSIGVNLKAEEVPYFVIPIGSPSNSGKRDIKFGQIAAVIYQDQVVYAVFVDECGVSSLIGEASYATNKMLGVNPDPKNGGTDGPVTFITFQGPTGRLTSGQYTSHAEAVKLGNARAKELLASHGIALDPSSSRPAVKTSAVPFQLTHSLLSVRGAGFHKMSVRNLDGREMMARSGEGARDYRFEGVQAGLYVVDVEVGGAKYTQKVALF
jgi:hypothetical protein